LSAQLPLQETMDLLQDDDNKVDNIFLCMIQSYDHLCRCTWAVQYPL